MAREYQPLISSGSKTTRGDVEMDVLCIVGLPNHTQKGCVRPGNTKDSLHAVPALAGRPPLSVAHVAVVRTGTCAPDHGIEAAHIPDRTHEHARATRRVRKMRGQLLPYDTQVRPTLSVCKVCPLAAASITFCTNSANRSYGSIRATTTTANNNNTRVRGGIIIATHGGMPCMQWACDH